MSRRVRTKFEFHRKREASVKDVSRGVFTQNVTREVTIIVPPQSVDGKTQNVVITALPLPTKMPPDPPKEKDIQKLVNMVIEPAVQAEDTGQALYDFDPPLTVTIAFTAEDAKAAVRDRVTGQPKLSIITHYQDEKKCWRWQKWDTTVTWDKRSDTGKLSAKVKTLHPNDPISEGSP